VRLAARVDEQGGIVVERSQGVQVGDWNTQRNRFSYKTVGQELDLEQLLHSHLDLVRSLAMMARYPDNKAVQRSFTHQIANAYGSADKPSVESLSQGSANSGLSVQHGDGVSLGRGNDREDKISFDVREVVLTGWESSARQIESMLPNQ